MEQNKEANVRYISIWALTGILFALIAGFICGGSSAKINDFYDVGHIFYLKTKGIECVETEGGYYDKKTNVYHIDTNDAKLTFRKGKKNIQYYYLDFTTENLSQDAIKAKFAFYNRAGNRVSEYENLFGNGRNVYQIPVAGGFCRLKIFIQNQTGVSFSIKDVQLRQQQNLFSKKRCAAAMIGVCLIYILGTIVIRRFFREKLILFVKKITNYIDDFIQILQFIYHLQEKPAVWISTHMGKDLRHFLRVGLLTLLSLYMIIMNKFGLYAKKEFYKYHMLLAFAILLLLGWLLYEGKFVYRKWNMSFARSWCILWIIVCICDALMGSLYLCTGYIMLFGFGSVFFFWNYQDSNRQIFLYEIAEGIFFAYMIRFVWLVIEIVIKKDVGEVLSIPNWQDWIFGWKSCIGNLNLMGNRGRVTNGGTPISICSGFLELMYRYGIFILIPYVNLFIHGLQRCKNLKRDVKICMVFQIMFLILMLTVDMEKPFLSPLWTAYYLQLGYCLQGSIPKQKGNKIPINL